MTIAGKIKGAISGTFNTLSGKNGWRSGIAGYGATANIAIGALATGALIVGTAGIALPAIVAGVSVAAAALNSNSAHRFANEHRQKKWPSL